LAALADRPRSTFLDFRTTAGGDASEEGARCAKSSMAQACAVPQRKTAAKERFERRESKETRRLLRLL
jgi:hypothetical protein